VEPPHSIVAPEQDTVRIDTTTAATEKPGRLAEAVSSEPSPSLRGIRSISETTSTSNTTTAQSSQQYKKRPTFVFYIGLPKTATSFLQCTLCSNTNVTAPLLLQDNYEYIGTCPHLTCNLETLPEEFLKHRWYAFFTPHHRAQEGLGPSLHTAAAEVASSSNSSNQDRRPAVQVAEQFRRHVDAVHERGHNGILIYEGSHVFPDDHIRAMADYLNPNWNVEIVVGYRPLYEWLPSKYNSVTKLGITGSWPGEPLKKKKGNKRAVEVLPFDIENRGPFSKMVESFETVYQKHPTEISVDNYRRHFSNVQVMAQHQLSPSGRGDPILENFFCVVIPDAPETCRQVTVDGALDFPTARNPSVSLAEDRLAIAAYRAGMLVVVDNDNGQERRIKPQRGQRQAVRKAIKMHLEELRNSTTGGSTDGYEFPLECWPQDKLDRLEKMSLDLERRLFQATWTPAQEEAHRAGFAATVAKNKFCHADTNKTLNEPEWKSFFASDEMKALLLENSGAKRKNAYRKPTTRTTRAKMVASEELKDFWFKQLNETRP